MITAQIGVKDGERFAATNGHAGYNPGNDVVCAAVSAIMWTLAGAVENLTDGGRKIIRCDDGYMDVRYLPAGGRDIETADVIFDAAHIGLLQIEKKHPAHVRVVCR